MTTYTVFDHMIRVVAAEPSEDHSFELPHQVVTSRTVVFQERRASPADMPRDISESPLARLLPLNISQCAWRESTRIGRTFHRKNSTDAR